MHVFDVAGVSAVKKLFGSGAWSSVVGSCQVSYVDPSTPPVKVQVLVHYPCVSLPACGIPHNGQRFVVRNNYEIIHRSQDFHGVVSWQTVRPHRSWKIFLSVLCKSIAIVTCVKLMYLKSIHALAGALPGPSSHACPSLRLLLPARC